MGPPRDGLAPLEGLAEATRLAMRLPLVVIATTSDVRRVDPVAPAHGSRPADAEAGSWAEREVRVFGRDTPLTGVLAHAVQQSGGAILIEDTRSHPLVRATPVIRGVRVLACAAIPIFHADGRVIGALCAWDGVPRWWSESDVELLTHLATCASALLQGNAEAPRVDRPSETVPAEGTDPLTVVGALSEGLLLLDAKGGVRWANEHAASALGLPLLTLRNATARDALERTVDPAVRSAWRRAAETGLPTTFAWHHQPSERWFEGYAIPVDTKVAIAMRDVTVSRRAEQMRDRRAMQRRDAETLDAVALLAGGVAHNFNNLLTVIAANAELLQSASSPDESSTERDEILRATTRATKLAQLLLACGRQLALEPDVVPLNDLVGAIEPATRAILPDTVRVETSLAAQDTRVHVDVWWLKQAVLQIVGNARDAMADGGVLRISTELQTIETAMPARPRTVPSGVWMVLSVEDTGHGIAPGHIDRVFEPFFTTRDVGSGIGLGLAAAFGIVAQSGGTCTVESQHGHGTTLRIWLPALTPAG